MCMAFVPQAIQACQRALQTCQNRENNKKSLPDRLLVEEALSQ